MAMGRLNDEQVQTLRKHVSSRHVHDLGAGDGALSFLLLASGARGVTAVDREVCLQSVGHHAGLELLQAYFRDVPAVGIDLAFLSWPVNRLEPHLLRLVEAAQGVIYLGSNCGGDSCGGPDLLGHFVHRELLAYVPDRWNSLLVLGRRLEKPRAATPEEHAGLLGWAGGPIVPFGANTEFGR